MIHSRADYQRVQDPENKIPADEPVFLIRGQDETAADTLQFWIRANRKLLKRDHASLTPEQIASRKKAIVLAEAHLYRMKDWKPQKAADA